MFHIPNSQVRSLVIAGFIMLGLGTLIAALTEPRVPPMPQYGLDRIVPAFFYDERCLWFMGGLLGAVACWWPAAKFSCLSADWKTILSNPWGRPKPQTKRMDK